MGIDNPLVCLSTYDHSRIGTLRESSEEIFIEAVTKLKTGKVEAADSEPYQPKKAMSPEKMGNLTLIPQDSMASLPED